MTDVRHRKCCREEEALLKGEVRGRIRQRRLGQLCPLQPKLLPFHYLRVDVLQRTKIL